MGILRKSAGIALGGLGLLQAVGGAFALKTIFTGAAGQLTAGTTAFIGAAAVLPPIAMLWGASALLNDGSAPAAAAPAPAAK